jgi:hypothetical protein
MRKSNLFPLSLFVFALALLVPSIASAGERVRWVGKDNDGYRLVYINTDGDNWIERYSRQKGDLPFKEVKSTDDYIELVSEGDGVTLRYRIYKDKALSATGLPSKPWHKFAEGEWED